MMLPLAAEALGSVAHSPASALFAGAPVFSCRRRPCTGGAARLEMRSCVVRARRGLRIGDICAEAVGFSFGGGDGGFQARPAGGELVKLLAHARLLVLKLAAALLAQLICLRRADQRDAAINILRFEVLFDLLRACLELSLFGDYIAQLSAQIFRILLRPGQVLR